MCAAHNTLYAFETLCNISAERNLVRLLFCKRRPGLRLCQKLQLQLLTINLKQHFKLLLGLHLMLSTIIHQENLT